MQMGKPTYKILLVDDDPDFVAAAKMVLQSKSDCQVFTASDGVFAVSTAKAKRPDLIILDVIMPFEDGFAAVRQLKADPELSKIPIIILTSFARRMGETDVSMVQGMDLEVEDYVEKPVSPGELLEKVNKLLQEKR